MSATGSGCIRDPVTVRRSARRPFVRGRCVHTAPEHGQGRHPDGSWGAGRAPAEETSHAILALDALEPHFRPAPTDVYQRAHTQLCTHLNDPDPPALWIAKTLYTPINVVRAAILTAHTLTLRHTRQTSARSTAPK